MPIYVDEHSVVCEFGDGDIAFCGKASRPEKGGVPQVFAVWFYNVEPGEVGRNAQKEIVGASEPQVKVKFTNIESLRIVSEAFAALLAHAESVQVKPEALNYEDASCN